MFHVNVIERRDTGCCFSESSEFIGRVDIKLVHPAFSMPVIYGQRYSGCVVPTLYYKTLGTDHLKLSST